MRRLPLSFLLSLVIAAAAVTGAGILMPRISQMRRAFSYGDPKQLPPEMAIAKLLGGFRGWFINYLWLRTNALQEQKKYHEALQLTKLITSLQPNFERVWDFQAWNLAWNISAATNSPQERWLWVEQGLRLLIDSGIPSNPYSRLLHQAAARIYQGKIYGDLDREHWYYKRKVAERWQLLLGTPPDDRSRESLRRWLGSVANAPSTIPEITTRDPELGTLLRVEIENGRSIDAAFCEAFLKGDAERGGTQAPPSTALLKWLASPEGSRGRQLFLAYARARVIREQERMDPGLMYDLTSWFGPFDWRHPASHALYWAAQGTLRHAARRIDVRLPWSAPGVEGARVPAEVDELLARTEVRQPLSILVLGGEVRHDESTGDFRYVPCPGFLAAEARAVFLFVTEDPAFEELQRKRLADCVLLCTVSGDRPRAEAFYAELKRRFPDAKNGTSYPVTAEEYVPREFVAQILEREPQARLEEAESQVMRLLFLGWLQGLSMLNADVTGYYQNLARAVGDRCREQGIALPEFESLLLASLRNYLKAPPGDVPPPAKQRLWNHPGMPQRLREAVYDDVKEVVLSQFARHGIDEIYFRREGQERRTPPPGPGEDK